MSPQDSRDAPVLASWEDGRAGPVGAEPLRAGLFETLHAIDGGLGFVERHLARLSSGAPRLGFDWPPRHDPRAGLTAVLHALGAREARVRLTLGRDAAGGARLRVEARAFTPPPEPLALRLGAAGSAPPVPEIPALKRTEREPWDALRAAARRSGALDVLLRDRLGRLVEGGSCNVHLVLGGRIVTPALSTGALPGVLRSVLGDALGGRGGCWTFEEGFPTVEDLAQADELLVSSALLEVRGVSRVLRGDRPVELPGPRGPAARALARLVARCAGREPRLP